MDSMNYLHRSGSLKMASSSNKKSPERGLFISSHLTIRGMAKITHATLSARINKPSIAGFKAIAP